MSIRDRDTLLGVPRPRRLPIPPYLLAGLLLGAVMTFYLAQSLLSTTPAPPPPPIRAPILLSPAKRFRIAVFSDLYFGASSYGAEPDQAALDLMRAVLAVEKPDLVILNGDLLAGEQIASRGKESAAQHLELLFSPMVDAGVPWASTYGDHDIQRDAMLEVERVYNLSHTEAQTDSKIPGVTNYVLPIGRDKYGTPSVLLWFFDSRGGREGGGDDGDAVPGLVAPETASWFLDTEAKLARRHSRFVPSLGFVHIPPTRFLFAQEHLNPERFPGLNFDVPAAVQSLGSSTPPGEVSNADESNADNADNADNNDNDDHEGASEGESEDDGGEKNPPPDASFLTALKASRGLHSLHAGHDRGNSWCAPWARRRRERTPFLCFARHTGYAGYGEWNRGARILDLGFGGELGRDIEVETWVRRDDGLVVDRVFLNGTYGVDIYAPES